jgi:hypothetical protein
MLRDSVAGFELTDEVLHRYPNEMGAINYLQVGLDFLYQQVEKAEAPIREKLKDFERVCWIGNPPWMKGLPRELLTCAFHWYATSACNLVKMIGWVRKEEDPDAPVPEDYLKAVLPEVFVWRNKVAAHFARHTPKKDTMAEQEASVFPPLGFENDAFYASLMTFGTTREGVTSTSEAIRPWSLTKVHLGLRARYGPVKS